MELAQLREVQHGMWLFGTKERVLGMVITPPNKLETDDSKVELTLKIITTGDGVNALEDIKINASNCGDYENVQNTLNLVSDPILWATLSYNAMLVDSLAHGLSLKSGAVGPTAKPQIIGG